MRRVAILGAGRGQLGLVRAAQKIDCHTTVLTMLGDKLPPAAEIADEVIEVDISEPKLVLEACKGIQFDAITTACFDTPMESLGALITERGLRGAKYSSAILCNNKRLLKEALVKHNLPTAKHKIISVSDLESINLMDLELPVVVKPIDCQGSAGVKICTSINQVQEAALNCVKVSRSADILVEEFIDGIEFGAQAIVQNGLVKAIFLHGDTVDTEENPIPIGHHIPFECSSGFRKKTEQIVTKAILALELDDCAVNIDLIYDIKRGIIYILELTGRAGANCLPELLSIYLGIDYYELIIRLALGDSISNLDVDSQWEDSILMSRMLISSNMGYFKALKSLYKGNEILFEQYFIKQGDLINTFRSSSDCIGQIVIRANSYNDGCRILNRFQSGISIEVESKSE